MKKSVPFVLVTGFLGSGKTTFLKKLLNKLPSEQKIAVIQNEFAPSNIDGEELMRSTSESFELLEVNNGSVFCVCLLGTFIQSLSEFIDVHQPDLILMEASGLSDPAGIAEMFQAAELREKVFFNEAWCVIDAAHFEKIEKMNVRYRHQVQVADHVIINKVDRVGMELTNKAEKRIRELNPFCKISKSSYCDINFDDFNKTGFRFSPVLEQRMDAEKSQGRPDIESCVLKMGVKVSPEVLKGAFKDMQNDLMRVKGFFMDENLKGYAYQQVHEDIAIEEIADYKGNLHLIFMGKDLNSRVLKEKVMTAIDKK